MLLTSAALAASLDNLEMGGPWGSPTATDGTAIWWNPAGLAAGKGTRLHLEIAPTFATFEFERAEPNPGLDTYTLSGVVPFLGAVTDFGVDGLGVGIGGGAPFVRGGKENDEAGGSGRFHMREGNSQTLWAGIGAAYEVKDIVAVGISGGIYYSMWSAYLDSDTVPALDHAITEQGQSSGYTDTLLENRDYSATLTFSDLTDVAMMFSAGVRVKPIDSLAIGVTYIHGADIQNEGRANIHFECPPQSDTIGRYGAEDLGLCYVDVPASASVAYTLPARVHGGIAWFPAEDVRIEAMGGWVGWGVYKDYVVTVKDAETEVEEGAELVNQVRYWARDNQDSWWVAIDGKVRVGEAVTVGAKMMYDKAAVPDTALSTNNWDGDTIAPSVLAAVKIGPMELGASFTHHFINTRTVDDNGFGMTLPEPDLSSYETDRWYYPHANGTYRGNINRVGVAVRAKF
jgi:long-subunit fatty acid transport protein